VAQAPIDELLASSGGLVYQVGIRGDGTHTQQVLAAQSWVTHITQQNKNGISLLQVSVTDEATAETELLRVLLADESVKVTEFCRQKYDLEEVFLNIVEGGRNGK
jgi:hypothetical protein